MADCNGAKRYLLLPALIRSLLVMSQVNVKVLNFHQQTQVEYWLHLRKKVSPVHLARNVLFAAPVPRCLQSYFIHCLGEG